MQSGNGLRFDIGTRELQLNKFKHRWAVLADGCCKRDTLFLVYEPLDGSTPELLLSG